MNLIGFVTILGGEGKKLEGPAMIDVPKKEVLDHFNGWEPEVLELFGVRVILLPELFLS